MKYPSPTDMALAPAWENYVIAQTVSASRGQIPAHALAFGVDVNGASVRIRVQLSELAQEDADDISDIVSELEALLGPAVTVDSHSEILENRVIRLDDGVAWTFLSRID